MSDGLFEFSLARFVEQYFYNDAISTNRDSMCQHCPLRDANLTFMMADGSTVNFNFTRTEVYSVDLLNLRQQNNNIDPVITLCMELRGKLDYTVGVKLCTINVMHTILSEAIARSQSQVTAFSKLASPVKIPEEPQQEATIDPEEER